MEIDNRFITDVKSSGRREILRKEISSSEKKVDIYYKKITSHLEYFRARPKLFVKAISILPCTTNEAAIALTKLVPGKKEKILNSLLLGTRDPEFVKFLIKKGADPCARDEDGLTLLQKACAEGDEELMEFLIPEVDDEDISDQDLEWFIENELLEVFLENVKNSQLRADLNIRAVQVNFDVADEQITTWFSNEDWECLGKALEDPKLARYIVKNFGRRLEKNLEALLANNPKVLNLLLSCAIRAQNSPLIEILINKGAITDVDKLEKAVVKDPVIQEIIQLLIRREVDPGTLFDKYISAGKIREDAYPILIKALHHKGLADILIKQYPHLIGDIMGKIPPDEKQAILGPLKKRFIVAIEDDKKVRIKLLKEIPLMPLLLACGDFEIQQVMPFYLPFMNQSQVVQVLALYPNLINVRDRDGQSPLHQAIANHYLKNIPLFLAKGANPNLADLKGNTPLHLLAYGIENEIEMDLLLKNNANPNLVNARGETPLQICLARKEKGKIALLLKYEANHRRPSTLTYNTIPQELQGLVAGKTGALDYTEIEAIKASPECAAFLNNRNDQGRTPLHEAIIKRDRDSALILIELGADLNLPDRDGNAPLHLCARRSAFAITELLLQRGANPNIADKKGLPPLYYHVLTNMELLLRYGAEPDFTRRGRTVLFFALAEKNEELIKLLTHYGADYARAEETLRMKTAANLLGVGATAPLKLNDGSSLEVELEGLPLRYAMTLIAQLFADFSDLFNGLSEINDAVEWSPSGADFRCGAASPAKIPSSRGRGGRRLKSR